MTTQPQNRALSPLALAIRSIRFHSRSTLGIFLGAVLGAAILVGAMAVGDSVRYSLRQMALARLGEIHHVLVGNEKFFRAELARNIETERKVKAAPLAFLRGTASLPDKGAESVAIGRVQVVGRNESLAKFFPDMPNMPEHAMINLRLASKLGAKVGDEILVRVEKPSLLSRDAPLSKVDDASVTIRMPIGKILSDAEGGRFSLEANQIPPLSVFLPIARVQAAVSLAGRANVILLGGGVTPSDATQSLWKNWQFTDAGLELRTLPLTQQVELRTDRVFLDPPIGDAALKGQTNSQGILTYFVNELRVGNRKTPYSVVSALEPGKGIIPNEMKDDEIILNKWLADDLGAKPGDALTTTFWTVGQLRKLEEKTQSFKVRAVVPITGQYADKELMPNIPGLSDKKNCREWEPGVPIELNKIRDKDEAYWATYKGTPKAFITLKAGQNIWNNRFGNLTMVRYPLETGASARSAEMCIRQALSPGMLGLFFVPVREQALAASKGGMDFGGLFIGFSFFLIVAALLLTALMFALGVEQRSEEVGTLLALGITPKLVQRMLLFEGAAIALVASIVGTLLATLYTRAVVAGLSGVWSGAVGNAALQYHAEPKTLVIGASAAFLTALFSIWLVTRRQAKVPARELLASGSEHETAIVSQTGKSKRLPGLITGAVTAIGALALAFVAAKGDAGTAAGAFFGAGALLLISGIAFCRAVLAKLERARSQTLSLTNLGVRNIARRSGRSLSAVGLLACGSFLVIAIGANRHDPAVDAEKRSSGTGGFALYGETALPIFHDMNTADGQEQWGIDAEEVQGVTWVPMRVRAGDDASCLNLNRAQKPRIFGVQTSAFKQRQAFTFGGLADGADKSEPWGVLDSMTTGDNTIPVVGDTNTVVWSLGKKLGDTLEYLDDRGVAHRLKIVGVLGNNILQGSLLMSEANFIRLFPGQSGYQAFLIDAPKAQSAAVAKTLGKAMEDAGLSLSPAAERLADFNAVENTYLSIFAILGGLGLLLGSVGLGVIVLRNVLERRGELALLRAVGFRANSLYRLIFSEHLLLLLLGLLTGIIAAIIAVLPALNSPGAGVPYVTLTLTLLAVFLSGFVWVGLATGAALRGSLLPALRNE